MMATVKYIRLLFKNEITITDDEIKLIVIQHMKSAIEIANHNKEEFINKKSN